MSDTAEVSDEDLNRVIAPLLGIESTLGEGKRAAILVFDQHGGVGVVSSMPTKTVIALVMRWLSGQIYDLSLPQKPHPVANDNKKVPEA